MDPQENIEEQERIIRRRGEGHAEPGDAARLAELREALRAWLARGGFAPVWTAAPCASVWFVCRGLVVVPVRAGVR